MPEDIAEDLPLKPYIANDKKYVICIDTLGQDCELTVDQKRFAL